MKVSLIFPTPTEQYRTPWSLERIIHPLPSGLAILTGSLEEKFQDIDVQCIGNQVVKKTKTYSFRYRTSEEFVNLCITSDVVGMSVLLHNIGESIKIACALKRRNSNQKIVFGGPGVSDIISAKLILTQENAVDYVVIGDGEQPLVDIVNGKNPADVPNLFYRHNDNIIRSKNRFVSNLNNRLLWDFRKTPDYKQVMNAFDSRTELYAQIRQKFGNFIGMVGVQLSKGCEKAEKMGRCFYCISAQNPKVIMRYANKFWEEVLHLYQIHGITEYFIIDNILATPKKLDALLTAKENFSVPDNIQFRAYGYVPFFNQRGGKEMMAKLKSAGVRNLFLGIENFDKHVNELSNKPGFDFSDVYRIVDQATKSGIDMFLPIMGGMPGDSGQSLHYNIECMEKLLRKFGSKEYGQGRLVRVDLSMAMPLRGTPWYNQLVKKKQLLAFYQEKTGVDLHCHIDLNYDVLREASLIFYHSTGLTENDLDQYRREFNEMCCKYIRPEQIGRFDPTILNERNI